MHMIPVLELNWAAIKLLITNSVVTKENLKND